jgi:hypothetical protein
MDEAYYVVLSQITIFILLDVDMTSCLCCKNLRGMLAM